MKSGIFQFVSAVLVAIVGAYAGFWFAQQSDDISMLEYFEDVDRNLQRIFGSAKDLKIIYKGEEIQEFSSVSYRVVNHTRKNIGNSNLYFEFKDGENLPVFYDVTPSKSYPKSAVKLVSMSELAYQFSLEYLNRSERFLDGILFRFYFVGSEPSEITLKTGTKGISIQEYKWKESPLIGYSVLGVLVLVVLILIVLLMYLRNSIKQKEEVFKDSVSSIFSDESISDEEKANRILLKARSVYSVGASKQPS